MTMQAQPDIKKNIYFSEKHCLEYKQRFVQMKAHPNGSLFGVYNTYSVSNMQWRLCKLNSNFETVWQKEYGGSGNEIMSFLNVLPNGNLLLTGTTNSHDGDVWYGQAISAQDIWILEVDTFGTIKKGRILRGTNGSDVRSTIVSSDGNIYLCGETSADQYDFAHPSYGWPDSDGWFAKLDTAFNLKWMKFFSGNSSEETQEIYEINTNRFIVCLNTASTDTALCGLQDKGAGDAMLAFIDSNGQVIWKRRYGGSMVDAGFKAAYDSTLQHIYISGRTDSDDGDIGYYTGTGNGNISKNVYNNWILQIDTLGTIIGSKAYGDVYSLGNGGTYIEDAIWYNNNLWTFCRTRGEGGDVDMNSNFNIQNVWIGVIDHQTNLIAKYTLNGYGYDEINNVFMKNGGLYLNGYSSANPQTNTFSCDTSSIFGFVLKLGEAPLEIKQTSSKESIVGTLYPNPTSGHFKLQTDAKHIRQINVYSVLGERVFAITNPSQEASVPIQLPSLPDGLYVLKASSDEGYFTQSFLVQTH